MSKYGLKEYKALLERAIQSYNDPMNCPMHLNPFTEGGVYRQAKQEALTYALEMLPEVEDE